MNKTRREYTFVDLFVAVPAPGVAVTAAICLHTAARGTDDERVPGAGLKVVLSYSTLKSTGRAPSFLREVSKHFRGTARGTCRDTHRGYIRSEWWGECHGSTVEGFATAVAALLHGKCLGTARDRRRDTPRVYAGGKNRDVVPQCLPR